MHYVVVAVAMSFDPTVVTKYNVGYQECAHEVDRYLGSIDGLSPEVRMRLMHHLGNSYNCANDTMVTSFQYRAAAAAALSLPFPSATSEASLSGSCLRSALSAPLCNMTDLSRVMAAELRRSPPLDEDLSARHADELEDCDINLDRINNNIVSEKDHNKPLRDKTEQNINVESSCHDMSKVLPPSGHSQSSLGVKQELEDVWRPW